MLSHAVPHTECAAGHEHVLVPPRGFQSAIDTAFGWSLTNWNSKRHGPISVYKVPHFDFHFRSRTESDSPWSAPNALNCEDCARAKLSAP